MQEPIRTITAVITANQTGRIAQVTRVSVSMEAESATWTQLASEANREAERAILAVAHMMMTREMLQDEEPD